MDAGKGKDCGSSSSGSRVNNRRPRGHNRDSGHTFEDLFVACILLSFGAIPVIFPQGSVPAGTTDHGMADQSGNVPPPDAHLVTLYYCGQCGRSFTSFQGLGGHISGHTRQALIDQMNRVSLDEGCSSQQPPMKRQRVERIHRCCTCGSVFPSGQALGGHMRAHYPGDLSRAGHAKNANNDNSNPNGGAMASSSRVNLPRDEHSVPVNVVIPVVNNNVVPDQVAKDGLTQASCLPRLDIDLNVKPEDEIEEEQQPDEKAVQGNED